VNIKTVLKSSVAVAALFAIAAPAANAEIGNGNKNSLTISGNISRVLWHADDGHSSEVFLTGGGENTSNRIRWVASGQLDDNVTVGATIELETPISNESQTATLHTTLVGVGGNSGGDQDAWDTKQEYIWVNHKTMGKLTLGYTSTASDGTAAPSLGRAGGSGRDGKSVGAGLIFIETSAAGVLSLSSVSIGEAATQSDGGVDDTLRYDTPSFGGLSAKFAVQSGGGWDTAFKYTGKFGAVVVDARIGYDNDEETNATAPFLVFGGVAVLHDSGLSANVGGGKTSWKIKDTNPGPVSRDNDPTFVNWGLGYTAKLTNFGATKFAFTYTKSEDGVTDDDDEDSKLVVMGVTASQSFDAVGLSMALSYRNYTFDSKTAAGLGNTFDDIDVVSLETIFKF